MSGSAAPAVPSAAAAVDVAAVRAQFPALANYVWFQNGGVSITPEPIAREHMRLMEELLARGPMHIIYPEEEYPRRRRSMERLARYFDADADELAVMRGVSEAFHTVLRGLPWEAGDRIVISDNEEAALLLPSLHLRERLGVEVVKLPLAEDREELMAAADAALTPKTRLLALSHVTTDIGFRFPAGPLCALARERGIPSFLDLAHSCGAVPYRLRDLGCDFAGLLSYKWMFSPYAAGALWVRREKLHDIEVTYAGCRAEKWLDFASDTFELPDTAQRFQYGPWSWPLVHAWAAAADWLQEIGPEAVWSRLRELTDRLKAGLGGIDGAELYTPRSSEDSAALVSFGLRGWTGEALTAALQERWNIVIKPLPHTVEGLRASVCFFHLEDEIDLLLGALEELAGGGKRMLSSFTIQDFKSYRKATLELAPLTVLIGANASGKSNAIEALRLLSLIAQGTRLGTMGYELQEETWAIRGTVNDLGFRDKDSFSLSCRTTHDRWDTYSIRLSRRQEGELRIDDERLIESCGGAPLFQVVGSQPAEGSVRVAYNNFARGGVKPQVNCVDDMAVLVQLQSSARFEGGHKAAQEAIPEVTRQYQGWLSNIVFLDPKPSLMRHYSFTNERKLNGHGANLSGALHNLCKEEKAEGELLQFIKTLPEQNIRKIEFVETPRGEAMVQLTETFGGIDTGYDATLLSDGTLRVLAVAAAVLSAPEGSVVVIEEIDNGVHPSRAEQLLEQLSQVAARRRLRVVLSSHNPALLDALPEEAVPDVVFCYRDPETGASDLRRLQDIPDYPELISQGAVGHLMTHGIIDRFVKMHPGPEEKKQQALSWLRELREQSG